MSSPFSTFQEFSETKGPIYTFANNPTMIGILLAISAVITLCFFVASYKIKPVNKSIDPTALGLMILAGTVSLISTLVHPAIDKTNETARRSQPDSALRQPLAVLGLIGIGGASVRRKLKRHARPTRRASRVRR